MSVLSWNGERKEMNKIINGDCIEVMKGFDENSIDCIVTDPPYGLNFMGKSWDKALPPKQAFIEMCRVLKPGALAFVMSSPRQDVMWRMAQMLEESGFSLKQSFMSWIYNSGFPKSYDIAKNGAGEKWQGWKSVTGLKPALEVIFMVQKPLSEKTIVDNVLKWDVGGMNVDGCRIPTNDEMKPQYNSPDKITVYGNYNKTQYIPHELKSNGEHSPYGMFAGAEWDKTKGRFPANIVVSDDVLNDGKIHKSGANHSIAKMEHGFLKGHPTQMNYEGDEGSASRYFDLDAWARHNGILQVPKASTSERDEGLSGEEQTIKVMENSKYRMENGEITNTRPITHRKNTHPCVKPIKLMSYLITLGCPKDGVVLDPFVGSGTTCVAAKRLGRKCVGIELNEEYYKIATERLEKEAETLGSFFKGEYE